MAESTKQITFAEQTDGTTSRTTYTITRLFNMHMKGFRIGAKYGANDFKERFANSQELQGVDIILE